MTDIAFPTLIGGAQLDWKLERNVTQLSNPLSKTIQRVVRGGDRWRATVQIPVLVGDEAARVCAWLDQISRGDNAGLVPVFQNDTTSVESGGTYFAEMQASWRNRAPALDWTSVNLVSTPYVSGLYANLYSGATAGAYMQRTFTVIANLPYNVVLDVPAQVTPGSMVVGNAGFSTIYYDGRPAPASGRIAITVVPTTSALSIQLAPANGTTTFAQSLFGDLSISRAYVAQSVSAAGANNVQIIGSDNANVVANLVPAFKAGQFLTITTSKGFELKRLQNPVETITGSVLNTIAVSGSGRAYFEPALRGSVAINAGIKHLVPWCRMLLASPTSQSNVTPPLRHAFSFDLMEDVT